ncbi:MAG: GGDEF domain-containing protein [Burkholderiaceae bacterium]|nr:GGDEF domain-containing protein [Burkholderiaceae bacterium]
MNLDLRTEFYFAITSLVVVALGLLMLWWRDRSASLRDWAVALCFGLLGNALAGSHIHDLETLAAAQGRYGTHLLAITGLLLVTAAYVLGVRGLVRHFDGVWSGRVWLILPLSILGFLCFMWPEPNGTAWSVISCYSRAFLCGAMLRVFLHNRTKLTPWSAALIVLPVVLQGCFLTLRGTAFLLGAGEWQGLLSPQLTYLVASAAVQAFILGLVILHVESLLVQLSNAANTDVLTGLHNRRSFNLLAAHQFEAARRQGFELWLLMLDIDHFKLVNDQHGHDEGDRLLRDVGALLRATVRQSDIVARYGGEEFCIVASHADAGHIQLLAARLMTAMNSIKDGPGADAACVTVSIGISRAGTADTLHDLIKRADLALYNAKNTGRKKAVYCPAVTAGYEDWAGTAQAA